VACAARTASELKETVRLIESNGGRAIAVQTEVSDVVAVEQLFNAAFERLGGVDILVVNAGVSGEHKRVDESQPEEWINVLTVNLVGAYVCARAAIPHLKARGGGKIVMLGSGLGHRGLPGTSAYASSKAGLWMLTRVLAQELIEDKIAVNELVPGPVATRADSGIVQAAYSSEWLKTPEDVTSLALFLATQPVNGPTGQSFSLTRREL
jgi:3-oxoacyl-[acyl-carrier protein] reductase